MPLPVDFPGLRRLGLLILIMAPPAAQASNGFNLVGFGVESLGLGSADIAVARDSTAVNINPAGLTQIDSRRFDGYIVPYYSFGVAHSDANNAKDDIDNPFGVLTGFSYAQKALRPDLTFGFGLFVSGGTGVTYKDLDTGLGTRDEYSAVLGVTKLATGVGWKLNDKLSLGAGLNLSYSALRQKIFPQTSSADPAFYGIRVDGADGLSVNGRVGLQYRPQPTLTLGLSYANATDIKLEDGTLTADFTALGLGRVKYRQADVEGFALAQELGAGVAWVFRPNWLFAGELTWLNWSDALRDASLVASRPDDPAAPATIAITQQLDHRGQYVIGLGIAYQWDDKTTLRGGLNIGRNPIPPSTLTPTLNLIAHGELDLGFSRKLAGGWEFGGAMQYQPYLSQRYDNPEQPFQSAKEQYGVLAWTLQLSRSW